MAAIPAQRAMLLAAAGAGAAIARWGATTRATRGERRAALPGDELVPRPLWQATRAIDVAARREDVWPWLVQMGYPTRRAGWYTPLWLDRLLFGITARSADAIVPELQHLRVGDRVPDSETGISFFTVASLGPAHELVLYSSTHPLPAYEDVAFSWAFVLRDRDGGSRLLMRARVSYRPVWPAALVRVLVPVAFGAGDLVQAGGMLRGIRRRVEAPR